MAPTIDSTCMHTHTHTHPYPLSPPTEDTWWTHDFSLQNRGPIHSDFSQRNCGLLCENLTLNRHNEDLDILPPMGDLPPYASLSCIKTEDVLGFLSVLVRRWNVKCVSSFVGGNKHTHTHGNCFIEGWRLISSRLYKRGWALDELESLLFFHWPS